MKGEMSRANLHEKIPAATDRFIIDFIEKLYSDGLEPAIQHVMESSRIEPEYNAVDEVALAEQRKKLEIMPGMMISNHPGRFDTMIVLDILKKRITERGDVKFLVAGGKFYEYLAGIFGKDLILSAESSKDPIGESVKHITENGGLLMIYPTGGQDTEFKSGFKLICQKIPDDSMVYAVQIDEHDLAMTDQTPVGEDKHSIQVHEAFTTVDEWTAELTDSEPAEQNHKMTEHYQSLFAEVNARQTYTTETSEDRENREKREDQLRLMEDLAKEAHSEGCQLYLFGGFADDFLLNGRNIKDDHSDIDCIGMRSDAFIIGDILKKVGCVDIKYVYANETYEEGELPVKVMANRGGAEIDVVFMDMDERRNQQYYSFTDDQDKNYSIYFDRDFFSKKEEDEPKSKLPIISALGLIQTKLFYPRIKDAKLREKDKKAAEDLRDKFFHGEDLSDKKFIPEIVEVT